MELLLEAWCSSFLYAFNVERPGAAYLIFLSNVESCSVLEMSISCYDIRKAVEIFLCFVAVLDFMMSFHGMIKTVKFVCVCVQVNGMKNVWQLLVL
jgi:hypothetical protein